MQPNSRFAEIGNSTSNILPYTSNISSKCLIVTFFVNLSTLIIGLPLTSGENERDIDLLLELFKHNLWGLISSEPSLTTRHYITHPEDLEK